MFFDLRFPSIDPWTDLEELLDPPEQADAGRPPTPPGGPMPSRSLERRDGDGAGAPQGPLAAAAGR
jgi:hypothetical protein